MLSSPFPESIAFACHHISELPDSPLLPEEQACLSSEAASKRCQEFALGRFCARKALSHFHIHAQPVLRHSETREPLWPESIVGSITHSNEWGVAAVGQKQSVLGVGVDLECFDRKVNLGIQRLVCVPEENQWLNALASEQQKHALILLFSAKESIFKCLFPLCREYIAFKDALVHIDEQHSSFEFALLKGFGELFPEGFQHKGNYTFAPDRVLSSLFLNSEKQS